MMKQSRTVLLALGVAVIFLVGSYGYTNTQNNPEPDYMTTTEINELVSSRMAGLAFSLPSDLDLNSIDVEDFYLKGEYKTPYLEIPKFVGATAYVGFNESLAFMENYFLCDRIDDNVEIQEALDYLTDGRTWQEKVYLEGNFSISSQVVLPSYVILDGEATINIGVSITSVNPFQSTSKSHITIRNLKFVGHYDLEHFIFLVSSSDCKVENCYFDTVYKEAVSFTSGQTILARRFIFSNNIVVNYAFRPDIANGAVEVDAQDVLITNNLFDHNGQGGQAYGGMLKGRLIVFENNIMRNGDGLVWITNPIMGGLTFSELITVANNIGENLTFYGVSIDPTIRFCKIIGNTLNYTGGRAMQIQGFGHKIIGNTIINSNDFSIYVQSPQTIVSDNNIYNCSTHVIYVKVNDCIISGNLINGGGHDGILIQDCNNTIVTGNRVFNCVDYGVSEEGTSDYTLLDGNILIGNTGGSHNVDATNSVVGDNII